MHWSDEGVVLSVRPHGEAGAVLELFTRGHGRHLGLVHGGRSRKLRPVLQTGNHVDAAWKARLADHLGHFTLELRKSYAALRPHTRRAVRCAPPPAVTPGLFASQYCIAFRPAVLGYARINVATLFSPQCPR